MQHFYDGQIRRYLTQIVRLLSNFSYKDSQGELVRIPVLYGDMTRQVASIINDNSENKLPSAPRMAVYITGLELDQTRLADSSYVSKLNIRERAYDEEGKEYLNTQGKNYTVERLMPTPYILNVNVDVWSTNTDQKLQILEQILMLFNPSLEIQTTDNYVDWTSLSVVNLTSTQFSSRTIPMGTETEIDVATLGFSTPIYISPPTKVKRLGVVTNIVTSIFDESQGTINLELSNPQLLAFADTSKPEATGKAKVAIDKDGNVTTEFDTMTSTKSGTQIFNSTTYHNYDLFVIGNTIKLIDNGVAGKRSWPEYLKAHGGDGIFQSGITEVRLRRADLDNEIVGYLALTTLDDYTMTVNWDSDTLPTDTVITGPTGDSSKINYIIDPLKTNPINLKQIGTRILLIAESIGDPSNEDGADAWKNADGTDFVAGANDIVEWNGSKWTIVFDSSSSADKTIYTTNLNTGVQYKWTGSEWLLAFEGEYPHGTWRLNF
mgnify:FL=1